MGMGFKFQMVMGMKSLKWEEICTKNLFPHTSTHNQGRRQVKIGLCGVDRHGERETITGVWRRSDPPTPPPVKVVGFVSISGATSSKSGVDMSTAHNSLHP